MLVHAEPTDLLLVTDVQLDFCPGGPLAVPDGDGVIAPINALMDRFAHVAATQDWHPAGHVSFASSHPGGRPFDSINLAYGAQTLWPDHCVQGSPGADLHPRLRHAPMEFILRKGFRRSIDSYSTFLENDRQTHTGLAGYLRERGFNRVVLVGLALDYCIRFSAEDARGMGFDVVVVTDACRAIAAASGLADAMRSMAAAGVIFAACSDFAKAGQ